MAETSETATAGPGATVYRHEDGTLLRLETTTVVG